MEINNINLISSLLKFESDDEFYFIQILKRKKENPEVSSNHNNNTRAIRTYYIKSLEHFNKVQDEIKSLCYATNSRAYIHLTPRSFIKTGNECAKIVLDRVLNNQHNHIYKSYNTACGKPEARSKNKKFLIDIDSKDDNIIENYINILYKTFKEYERECDLNIIPTKNGIHLICSPFNIQMFNNICKELNYDLVDIHKNNPTLLYFKED